MSSPAKAVCFFALCFAFGLSAFFGVSDQVTTQRDPASLPNKVFQITSLSSDQIKTHIMSKIKVFPTMAGKKGIQFSGFSSALCKIYPEVELEFKAEGVAVAGEIPTMTISSPCLSGQDPSEMAIIQLPVEKLLAEKPRSAEFAFTGFNTKLSFKNAADEWPKVWVLKTVNFKSAEGKNKVANFGRNIASEPSTTRTERPVVLEF